MVGLVIHPHHWLFWCMLHHTQYTFYDIIYIGEVALAVAIVEDLNSFALTQLVGEAKVSHIWTTSRGHKQ